MVRHTKPRLGLSSYDHWLHWSAPVAQYSVLISSDDFQMIIHLKYQMDGMCCSRQMNWTPENVDCLVTLCLWRGLVYRFFFNNVLYKKKKKKLRRCESVQHNISYWLCDSRISSHIGSASTFGFIYWHSCVSSVPWCPHSSASLGEVG